MNTRSSSLSDAWDRLDESLEAASRTGDPDFLAVIRESILLLIVPHLVNIPEFSVESGRMPRIRGREYPPAFDRADPMWWISVHVDVQEREGYQITIWIRVENRINYTSSAIRFDRSAEEPFAQVVQEAERVARECSGSGWLGGIKEKLT